jgi:hypothetical protein
MIFSRIAPSFLSSLAPLSAADFPVVPPSSRALTVDQVKTFWVDRQYVLSDDIRKGKHDLAARLVCLSHNVASWSRLGDEAKSQAAEQHLIQLREHVARLATLEAQLESAARRGATDRMAEVIAEILRVKSLLARKDELCG